MTKEERNAYQKEYYKAHKEQCKAANKAYYEAHREEHNAYMKAYYEAHKEQRKASRKAWHEAHKEHYNAYMKDYNKADVNSLGQTKDSIRKKSQRYLKKYGTKISGYEIHHCCTYDEPYKFIYCSIEMHRLIHAYLRQHNIDADSEHYEQIKHLLDESVVKYGID